MKKQVRYVYVDQHKLRGDVSRHCRLDRQSSADTSSRHCRLDRQSSVVTNKQVHGSRIKSGMTDGLLSCKPTGDSGRRTIGLLSRSVVVCCLVVSLSLSVLLTGCSSAFAESANPDASEATTSSQTVPVETTQSQTPQSESAQAETTLPSLESGIDTAKEAQVENKAEIVYALLGYDGAVDETYVVNRFRVTSEGSFNDFGSYSKVDNLTNTEEITQSGNEIHLAAAEGDFYYQGTLKNPALPWDISFEYTLDGKKIAASEVSSLGGKSGRLGITIHTKAHEGVDARFFEHYMLQISLTLPSNNIDNLSAEGATVATAGSDTQVTYAVLPDSEGSYEFEVDFDAINMPGISVAAVPYGMEFEMPDTSGMSSELATLSTAIAQLSNGTQQINSGLASAASGFEALVGYSDLINTGLAGLGGQSNSIASSSAYLNGQLSDVAAALQYLYATGAITPADEQTQYQLEAALEGLGALSEGYTQLDAGLQQYMGAVSQLAAEYPQINNGISSSATGLRTLSSSLDTLSAGSSELSAGVQNMPEEMQKQIDEFAAAYDFSGFEPASFVSTKNENVVLVQFVFTTPAIDLPKEVEDEDEISTESSILDKLIALFTGE